MSPSSLFPWRVTFQVSFLGVCRRLLSLFSSRVSPSNEVCFLGVVASSLLFLACVAFELVLSTCRFSVSSHGMYRLHVCFHGVCHLSHLQVVVHGVGRLSFQVWFHLFIPAVDWAYVAYNPSWFLANVTFTVVSFTMHRTPSKLSTK